MTLAQFCHLPGAAQSIELAALLDFANALAAELHVKPSEALYALMPNSEPAEP